MLGRKIEDPFFRISVVDCRAMRCVSGFILQSLEIVPYRIFELHLVVVYGQTRVGTMIIRLKYLGFVPEIVDSDCSLAGVGSDVEDEIIAYELLYVLGVVG